MKCVYAFVFAIICSVALVAQEKPMWVNSSYRQATYPTDSYLVGFSFDDVRANELPVKKVMEKCVAIAKKNLTESITAKVKTRTTTTAAEIDGQVNNNIETRVEVSSNININGIQILSYYDQENKKVYAFAYANRQNVIDFYTTQVQMLLDAMQQNIDDAQYASNNVYSLYTRTKYLTALDKCTDVQQAQIMLTLFTSDSAKMQNERFHHLQSMATQALHKQKVVVYVHSDETNFGNPVLLLAPSIQAALADSGCVFTDKPTDAVFIINIMASTTQYPTMTPPANGKPHFTNLNAMVVIENNLTKKEIFKKHFVYKSGGLNYETAGNIAYHNAHEVMVTEICNAMSQ